ncbi:MAG: hypothetical protein U9N78_11305 [Actinomycetota bacterium]|nr:hypothetical protein [Actinomycetota bacterium]
MTRSATRGHGKNSGGSGASIPMTGSRWGLAAVALIAVIVVTSCTPSEDAAQATSTTGNTSSVATGCADVVAATIEVSGDAYRVSATILSADTGWEKYADAWEVRAPDGTVLGTRVLAHPHVDEQPFTRSLGDVDVPEGVGVVEIVARDLIAGFCGETVTITVPGR